MPAKKLAAAKKPGAEGTARASAAASPARPAASAVVVGRLMAGSTPLAPLVEFAGNRAGPLRARATVALDRAAVDRAVVTGQGATLVFEDGDPRLPIVTGLVQSSQATTPFQDLLVSSGSAPRPAAAPMTSPTGLAGRLPLEARLDGERIVLEGKHEVVLKCGEASITLRRDGKMVLRGTYVETYARGVNRIKGGSVKIN